MASADSGFDFGCVSIPAAVQPGGAVHSLRARTPTATSHRGAPDTAGGLPRTAPRGGRRWAAVHRRRTGRPAFGRVPPFRARRCQVRQRAQRCTAVRKKESFAVVERD